ncbi:hypothetical protein AFLA70_462g000760 [Aspergillus flavus AF70]|nr:hypothetical protein AFLA70_462g000760 [Aspergillus flavus AF70]
MQSFLETIGEGGAADWSSLRQLGVKILDSDQTDPRFCTVPPSVAPSGLRVSIRRFSMDFNAFYEPLRLSSALYIDPALGLEPIIVTRWGFPLSSYREIVKEAVQVGV